MFDSCEPTAEFAQVERIASAIRRELGDEVEAFPGFRAPEEAEPLNRIFRALARCILEPGVAPEDDLSRRVSQAFLRLVRRRLAAGGLGDVEIPILLDLEPGTLDDWFTFLLLTPWAEVRFWLRPAD